MERVPFLPLVVDFLKVIVVPTSLTVSCNASDIPAAGMETDAKQTPIPVVIEPSEQTI